MGCSFLEKKRKINFLVTTFYFYFYNLFETVTHTPLGYEANQSTYSNL